MLHTDELTSTTIAGTLDPPFRILLAFSGIKGALASAPTFNNRVAECREAASALLSAAGRPDAVPILGNISLEEYESLVAANLPGKAFTFVAIESG